MSKYFIKNEGAPIGEIAQGLAGKESTETGAGYIVPRTIVVPLSGGVSSEMSFGIENPESYPMWVRGIDLHIQTAGQSSASMNIGIVASSSKTAADLVSSGDLATAEIVNCSMVGNASLWQKNGNSSDAWITGKVVVDGASSLDGYAYIEAVPVHST